MEEEEEEERSDGKRSRDEEDVVSDLEEKERQEAKKKRIEEGEISDEGLLRALSASSVELGDEVDDALSHLESSEAVVGSNSNDPRPVDESRPVPKRIDTGIMSHIPSELLYHILKFLSSEVSRFSFIYTSKNPVLNCDMDIILLC